MSGSVISQCPSCSRVLYFSHEDTTIVVCSCGTVVNRKEGGVLLSKPFYIITDAFDSIQPGTTGTWQGQGFQVLGRFRTWLDESVFNYWTVLFSDGSLRWLGEGYGLYAIMKKIPVDASTILKLGILDIKDRVPLVNGKEYILEKKSQVRKWEVEGEVYLPECDSSFQIFDFASVDGSNVTVMRFLPNFSMGFEAEYTSFASLSLQNLRSTSLPGKSFNCTQCKQLITVKTWPYAQSCACTNCGSFYHLGSHNSFVSLNERSSLDAAPLIALGSTGMIKDILYECIGFTYKEENNQYHSRWTEYTLYNREEGYAFLSEYSGHWIFLRERADSPVLPEGRPNSFDFGKDFFQLYNSYSYTILSAQGEFPENIFDAAQTKASEFIAPPQIWIQEYNAKQGVVWFFGEHISGSSLSSQFQFTDSLPYKSGIGVVEPKYSIPQYKVLGGGVIAIFVLMLIHFFITQNKKEQVLLEDTYGFKDSVSTLSFVTPKFHLDKWRSNLEFTVYAPVSNDWFELDATVVNANTGTEYSLEKGVEYYNGVEDGESWSEGSQSEDAYLTYLPAGDYFIQVQGVRSMTRPVPYFQMRVTYDVSNTRNLWWSILLVALWPAFQMIRSNRIEKKRWYNSPFSPYEYED